MKKETKMRPERSERMKRTLRISALFLCVALLAISAALVLTYLNQKYSTPSDSSATAQPVSDSQAQSQYVNGTNGTYAGPALNGTRIPANGMRFPSNSMAGGGPRGAPPGAMNATAPDGGNVPT